jgi:hypothetical protein
MAMTTQRFAPGGDIPTNCRAPVPTSQAPAHGVEPTPPTQSGPAAASTQDFRTFGTHTITDPKNIRYMDNFVLRVRNYRVHSEVAALWEACEKNNLHGPKGRVASADDFLAISSAKERLDFINSVIHTQPGILDTMRSRIHNHVADLGIIKKSRDINAGLDEAELAAIGKVERIAGRPLLTDQCFRSFLRALRTQGPCEIDHITKFQQLNGARQKAVLDRLQELEVLRPDARSILEKVETFRPLLPDDPNSTVNWRDR